LITPDNMLGFSGAQKVQAISKVFADSWKSPMSVVVVDNIEDLLGEQNLRRTNLLPPECADVMNEFVAQIGHLRAEASPMRCCRPSGCLWQGVPQR